MIHDKNETNELKMDQKIICNDNETNKVELELK